MTFQATFPVLDSAEPIAGTTQKMLESRIRSAAKAAATWPWSGVGDLWETIQGEFGCNVWDYSQDWQVGLCRLTEKRKGTWIRWSKWVK